MNRSEKISVDVLVPAYRQAIADGKTFSQLADELNMVEKSLYQRINQLRSELRKQYVTNKLSGDLSEYDKSVAPIDQTLKGRKLQEATEHWLSCVREIIEREAIDKVNALLPMLGGGSDGGRNTQKKQVVSSLLSELL